MIGDRRRRAVEGMHASGEVCSKRPILVILTASAQRKSPLQKRAVSILTPWHGLGMEPLSGVTACSDYTTRQKLRQERSAPSLSQQR